MVMSAGRWRTSGPALRGTSRSLANYTAYLYLIGALTGFVLAIEAARQDGPAVPVSFGTAVFGLVMGVSVLRWGRRWPWPTANISVAVSVPIIAFGAVVSPDTLVAFAAASIAALVSVYAMIFYSWKIAWFYVAAVTGIQLLVLSKFEAPTLVILAMAVLWLGQAGVVGVLVREASAASIDSLTGLINRRGWDEQMTDILYWSTRRNESVCVALIDIDFFKQVNDDLGHAAGDVLLRNTADAWKKLGLEGILLARRGGDEFAVLLPGRELPGALRIVERLRHAAPTAVSSGVAQHRAGESASDFLRRADTALYAAKAGGRDRTAVSDEPDEALAEHLARALVQDEISVALQPIFEVATHEVTGFEVLARWTHPVCGEVPPSAFIPVAETSGLISQLDAIVLRKGLELGPELQQAVGRPIALSVNASGRELLEPGYAERLLKALEEAKWPASQLCVEVTESLLDGSSAPALAALTQLRAHGIMIAIDDFGTGWSSFSRLDALPVDHLKLDRSFITMLPSLPRRRAIVRALLGMCRELGIDVIAEGVESREQCTLLRELGCPRAQGFHFSKPVTATNLLEALREGGLDHC